MRRHLSLGFVIWLVIGLVVAANHGYLMAWVVSSVLSAVLAVLAWPLVVFNVDVGGAWLLMLGASPPGMLLVPHD